MLYDMHCHLDLMPKMKSIIKESLNEDLSIVTVTTTPKAFNQEVDYCKINPNINVALGLHPQLIAERSNELSVVLDSIHDVKYIGEIGLDFNNQYAKSKEKQIEVFTNIIKECSKLGNKTISIHSVKSAQNVLDILKSFNTLRNNYCILHWFTGGEKQLKQAISLGCYFSINERMLNTITGKKLIQSIPENRILVETDAPFINEITQCNQIYRELEQTIFEISKLRNKDLYEAICENSKYVLNKQ